MASGPLTAGWLQSAPYEAILLEGAIEIVPDALLAQLKDGGRLVAVIGSVPMGKAMIYRKAGGRVTDMFGGEDWLEGQTFVGTNGKIHDALRSRLDPVQADGHVRIP